MTEALISNLAVCITLIICCAMVCGLAWKISNGGEVQKNHDFVMGVSANAREMNDLMSKRIDNIQGRVDALESKAALRRV